MKYVGDSEWENLTSGNTCRPANMLCITCDYAFSATQSRYSIVTAQVGGWVGGGGIYIYIYIYINTWRVQMDS
jgi:hypothetical protein